MDYEQQIIDICKKAGIPIRDRQNKNTPYWREIEEIRKKVFLIK
jgi:hypothetical protein